MNRAGLPIALLFAAGTAQAERPTYSFVDAALLQSENEQQTFKAQGPRLALNMSLSRLWYFTGEYDQQDFDGSDNKLSAASAGFGVHTPRSTLQMFWAATYERLDLNDDDAASDSQDEGYGLQFGFRLPAGFFELGADARYLDFGDAPEGGSDNDMRYRGTLLAHVMDNVAALATLERFEDSDAEQWTAGVRVFFDSGHDRPRKKKNPAEQ